MSELYEEKDGTWTLDGEPTPGQPPRCPYPELGHDRAGCPYCERRRRWVRSLVDRLEAEEQDDGAGWSPVLLSAAPDLPAPSLLELGEGTGDYLIRRGDVVNVHGVFGAGKTPLCYLMAAREVQRGNLVLLIDYEMGPPRARALLAELGLSGAQIDEGVCYVPNPPVLTGSGAARLMAELDRREETTGRPLAVVVIDSLTKSMSRLPGVSDNDAQDVASWYGDLPHWLRDETGAAVAVIDHSARTDGPHPSGSHKKAEEADFHVWLRHEVKFSRARPERGRSALVVVKDRSGERELDVPVAYLRTTGEGGTFEVEPAARPSEGDGEVDVPFDRMPGPPFEEEDVLRDLREAGTAGLMKTELTGRGAAGKIRRDALARLEKDGKAVVRPSGRGQRCYAAEHAQPGEERP